MNQLSFALTEQFRAGLAMLAKCVEVCPEESWTKGDHPRTFWRIVMHAAFFTQIALSKDEHSVISWGGHPVPLDPAWMEPFELPEDAIVTSKSQALEYIRFVQGIASHELESADLESSEVGISWYPGFGRADHLLMGLRHLQGHVGQLSERLMDEGIDTDWIGKGNADEWSAWERENP